MNELIEFIFPRRLHRFAYFLRGIVVEVSMLFLFDNRGATDPLAFVVLILGLAVYSLVFIMLPRIRDVGMSGWWLAAAFIPVANVMLGIVLLFRPPHYSVFDHAAEVDPQPAVDPNNS